MRSTLNLCPKSNYTFNITVTNYFFELHIILRGDTKLYVTIVIRFKKL
jgi:hypothetical protein